MASDDPAALAASTAQGWAYALNTVARPAPEHLEAAQEALTALGRADRDVRWAGVADTLAEALMSARLRVGGGRPEITVAQLLEAIDQLRAAGLNGQDAATSMQIDGYRTMQDRAAERIAELEEELENAEERRQAVLETLASRRQLCDRFEQERNAAQRNATLAHQRDMAAVERAREDSRRAGYVWCLAELGNSIPGYDDMPTEELRDLAARRLQEVNLDSGTLRHVAKELLCAERLLSANYDGAPYLRPNQDKPLELASVVTLLASRAQRAHRAALERQAELEGQLAELRPDMDLAVVRAERDMLTRARDAQAAELRALREERDNAEEARTTLQNSLAQEAARITELQEALEAERGVPGPSQTRWSDILRERDSLRRRIAELEATLAAEQEELDLSPQERERDES